MKKAVITFTVIDNHAEKTTCNIVESLDIKLGRVYERLKDIMNKYPVCGNFILQFVEEE